MSQIKIIREKAPVWVILGILMLYFLDAIIEFLGFLDLIPIKRVYFENEYGESVGISNSIIWTIANAIKSIFFGWLVVIAICRKWRRAVTIGALLLVCKFAGSELLLWWQMAAKNYHELRSCFDIAYPADYILILLYFIGILLVVWNTNVKKGVKISITIYAILFLIAYYLVGFYDYFILVDPWLSMSLLALYFYNRRVPQDQPLV